MEEQANRYHSVQQINARFASTGSPIRHVLAPERLQRALTLTKQVLRVRCARLVQAVLKGRVAFVNQHPFFLNRKLSSFVPEGRFRIGAKFLSVTDHRTIFNARTGVCYSDPDTLTYRQMKNGTGG